MIIQQRITNTFQYQGTISSGFWLQSSEAPSKSSVQGGIAATKKDLKQPFCGKPCSKPVKTVFEPNG
jgi:hypothetical protein